MGGVDVCLRQPLQNGFGHELWAIVGSHVLRAARNADQLAQHLDDSAGADAAGHVDRQALMRKLINDRQTLQLLPVGAGIEDEIVRPYLAHGGWRQWPRTRTSYTPPCPLFRHLQLVQPPEPMGPIGAHPMSASLHKDLDAPISVPRVLSRELVHH